MNKITTANKSKNKTRGETMMKKTILKPAALLISLTLILSIFAPAASV